MLLIKIYVYIFFNPKVMFQLFRILLKSLKSIMNLRVIIKVGGKFIAIQIIASISRISYYNFFLGIF